MGVDFDEGEAVSLLNWMARHNRRVLVKNPDFPGLYESGVRYEREEVETWLDYTELLVQGHEDCDGLAAARAGELLARGWRALHQGEGGFAAARELRLGSIVAEVVLATRTLPGEHGLYHCIVRYVVDGRVYWDDPSARLGMLDRRLSAQETQLRLRQRVQLSGHLLRPRRAPVGAPRSPAGRRRPQLRSAS